MNILVTGFEPFDQFSDNPTKEVISLLPKSIKGHPIIGIVLPVVYEEAFLEVKKYIDHYQPEIIINLGLAGGRKGITPERVALNVNDASIPDNKGLLRKEHTIINDGPDAYFTRLPLLCITKTLESKHIPTSISNTAGLYVCNDLMYRVLHYLNQEDSKAKAGFIHVPFMEESNPKNDYSLPLSTILEAVIDSIKCCL